MKKAVIGLGFGDEGKGITTDFLCSHSVHPLVIRYSGGQQAGHTVLRNGVRHVFSNIGSGSMQGIPTYWSKFCTVDPIGLVNEISILKEKWKKLHGTDLDFKLYIDERCPITTPYDTYQNQVEARAKGHGSCGVGVGTTQKREEQRYSLTFGDLYNSFVFQTKLDLVRAYYISLHHAEADQKSFDKMISLNTKRFNDCCQMIKELTYIKPVFGLPKNEKIGGHLVRTYSSFIFEGSQGLLLDQQYGFFPHVTRSNTGSKNIIEICGDNSIEYYLVTRAYQTRHGNGPMSNDKLGHNINLDENETNVTNEFQGNFRRSLLDVSLLEYGINKDEGIRNSSNKTLVITCLDHIVNEYRFTYNGQIVFCDNENDFVNKVSSLLKIKKVIISRSADSKNFEYYGTV